MLILERILGEKIIINDDITIKILGVQRMQVKIGIEAPKKMRVDREEIRRKINNSKINIGDE